MTELEKIQYTKAFIDKLANGVNPLNDEPIPDGDLLNNVRISQCMFYVSGILDNVCTQLSAPAPIFRSRSVKLPFCIGEEDIKRFEYSQFGMSARDIANALNALIDQNKMRKISAIAINAWLVREKLLEEYQDEIGRKKKRVTDAGKNIGIESEPRIGKLGLEYEAISFTNNAQRYIVEHANDIVTRGQYEGESISNEFQGKPWDEEQERRLVEMFKDGLVVKEIAKELQRSYGGIRARLVKLGLIDNRSDAN